MEQSFNSKSVASIKSAIFNLHTLWLFTCSNHVDIVLLSLIFGILSAFSAPLLGLSTTVSALHIITFVPSMLLWSWINLLLLCLQNQHHPISIAEDALNKPWRPLPAGRISPAQVDILLYATYPTALLISIWTGGVLPCLGVILFGILYNEFGGSDDPWAKNILNATGIISLLAGPLEVVTRQSAFGSALSGGDTTAAKWFGVIGGAILSTVQAQDFRDRDGDARAGRRTLPLVIGDTATRVLTAFGVLGSTAAAGCFWGSDWRDFAVPAVSGVWFLVCLSKDRSIKADRETWKIWPVWFMALFLLPVLKSWRVGF